MDTVFHSVPPWCWVVAIFHRDFINQPVTSRGNATLTTYNTLHNQSEKSSRFPPEEAWGDRERSRKWSRDGGRVAGRPGRVAVGPLQRLTSTTSLCSASSAAAPHCRAVTWLRGRSPLHCRQKQRALWVIWPQPTNMLLFLSCKKKKMHLVLILKLSLNLKNISAGIALRHTLWPGQFNAVHHKVQSHTHP